MAELMIGEHDRIMREIIFLQRYTKMAWTDLKEAIAGLTAAVDTKLSDLEARIAALEASSVDPSDLQAVIDQVNAETVKVNAVP